MGTLYIVATPIGNLKDITLRALETLKLADLILAEDTRVTKKLCAHYGISKPVERYDGHAGPGVYGRVRDLLASGRSVALVTDAGTPGISDPGSRLVSSIRIELPDTHIVAVPGPSAVVSALSIAGIGADRFTFLGYPPHRKGRKTFFQEMLAVQTRPIVLYESPHRIAKTFGDIRDAYTTDVRVIVGRELTKVHEEIFDGTTAEALEHFKGERGRGEFVIVLP